MKKREGFCPWFFLLNTLCFPLFLPFGKLLHPFFERFFQKKKECKKTNQKRKKEDSGQSSF
jgi:hypothetical protein